MTRFAAGCVPRLLNTSITVVGFQPRRNEIVCKERLLDGEGWVFKMFFQLITGCVLVRFKLLDSIPIGFVQVVTKNMVGVLQNFPKKVPPHEHFSVNQCNVMCFGTCSATGQQLKDEDDQLKL